MLPKLSQVCIILLENFNFFFLIGIPLTERQYLQQYVLESGLQLGKKE